jgi:hypothetical protein
MRTHQQRGMESPGSRGFSGPQDHMNGGERYSGRNQDNEWQTSGSPRYADNNNNYENEWNEPYEYDDYSYKGEWQNEPEGYNSAFNEGDDIDEGYDRGGYRAYGNGGGYNDEPDDDWGYYDTGSYRSQGGYPERYEEDFGRNGNDFNRNNRFGEDRHPGHVGFNQGQDRYSDGRGRMGFTGMDREEMSGRGRHGFEYRDDYNYIPDRREEMYNDYDAFEDDSYEDYEEEYGTSRRGFASMDPQEVRRIARLGGLASHKNDGLRNKRSNTSGSSRSSSGSSQSKNGTSRRGFASMDPKEVRRIARMGGLASHKNDNKSSRSSSSISRRTRETAASSSRRTRSTTSSTGRRSGSSSISGKSKSSSAGSSSKRG